MKNYGLAIWLVVIALVAYYFYQKKRGKPFIPNLVTRHDNLQSNTMNVRGDLFTARDHLDNIPALGTTFSPTPTMKPTGVDPVIDYAPTGSMVNPSIPSMAGANATIGVISDTIVNGVDLFNASGGITPDAGGVDKLLFTTAAGARVYQRPNGDTYTTYTNA